ncbi:Multifunctional cytochrome P450 monooxygenase af510 [Sparassis crispa]|uniref:Multifunctional cytochrome P450 monooxygenase af510 n=1 Tax=Sparassis crispa TaxID=139825 RepID=A0A401H550_9APHY|nr:Multifunctional cytochrome P450 monooxygenase af510 [Sparassis crispa]GBE89499.1 Multifunctional cytochrome P450 monooxygenase af510 [Sparassis crispa]
MDSVTAYLCSCTVILALILIGRRHKSALPLPPGPPADPIIGHLRKFSFARQHELFREWATKYGDIFQLHILGRNIVVLNSLQVATDLMDKRSAKYSDRPSCTTLEMMGYDTNVAFMEYGPRWKKHRKIFRGYFNENESLTYRSQQTRGAHALLKDLLTSPHAFIEVTQRFAMRGVLEIAYGHQVHSDDDVYVKLTADALHGADEAKLGVSLVDFFPLLAYLPHWLPGCSSFTAAARRWGPVTREMHDYPFNDVLKQMDAGIAQPSFLSSYLERYKTEGAKDYDLGDLKGAAGTILTAGAETTWSLILTFYFCMLLFPEVQHRAQVEIDRVIGPGRLPDFSDRDALPFVEYVLQETIRWHPAAPQGIAHRSVDDDIYNGMFIARGSIIIPNVMAMSRDETMYKDAEAFCPERFLPSPAGRGEPYLGAVFGFGRRICPGRYFADNSAWIVAATVLATFDICKAVDKDGKAIEPDVVFTTDGLASRPKPFECVFQPRSEMAKKLIIQQENLGED